MRHILLLTLFFALFGNANACVNEESLQLNGKVVRSIFDRQGHVPGMHDFEGRKEYLIEKLQEMDSLWRRNRKIEDYSDYGAALIYLNRLEEAKAVFSNIESMQPGRYSTAANIGTIYELLGKNDSALYWIKRAVEIDPDSHDGSEWLHVKILEAKIGGADLVNSKFLIGTEFGNEIDPKTSLDSTALARLAASLFYQLDERMFFVKPKEEIVAQLLFELGNVYAISKDLVSAMQVYDKARTYGYEDDVFKKRYESFKAQLFAANLDNEYLKGLKEKELLAASQPPSRLSNRSILLIIGGVLVVLIVLGIRLARGE